MSTSLQKAAILAGLAIASAACGGSRPPVATPVVPAKVEAKDALRAPEEFARITDREQRSRALFVEASRVITSPRCVNCHPSDGSPRQRDAHEMHDPPVQRGPKDEGIVGATCGTCHQDANVELARVPGAPKWKLAPIEMAWLGKSVPQICEQLKDSARNGHRSLAQLVDHSKNDKLVGWGWSPGSDRKPAPGTQERFGALIAAWVDTGAACPREGAAK